MSVFRVPNLENRFIFKLVSLSTFLATSDLKFRHLRFQNHCFRMEGIAKIDFSWKSFFCEFRTGFFCVFVKPWEQFF